MATLKELIKKHGMGDGQIYTNIKINDLWFEPKYYHKNFYYGHDHNDYASAADECEEWWAFAATVKKKKVKRWLWAFKNNKGALVMHDIFSSEEEATERHAVSTIKLTWSETLFDE